MSLKTLAPQLVAAGYTAAEALVLAKRTYARDKDGQFASTGSGGAHSKRPAASAQQLRERRRLSTDQAARIENIRDRAKAQSNMMHAYDQANQPHPASRHFGEAGLHYYDAHTQLRAAASAHRKMTAAAQAATGLQRQAGSESHRYWHGIMRDAMSDAGTSFGHARRSRNKALHLLNTMKNPSHRMP